TCTAQVYAGQDVLTLYADVRDPNSQVLWQFPITISQESSFPIISDYSVPSGCVVPDGESTCPLAISWSGIHAPHGGAVIVNGSQYTQIDGCTPGMTGSCSVNLSVGDYLITILGDVNDPSTLNFAPIPVKVTPQTQPPAELISADLGPASCQIPSLSI